MKAPSVVLHPAHRATPVLAARGGPKTARFARLLAGRVLPQPAPPTEALSVSSGPERHSGARREGRAVGDRERPMEAERGGFDDGLEGPREQGAGVEIATAPEAWCLDPLERALWQPAAHATTSGADRTPTAQPPSALPPLDALVDRFLKRFAMSGDRHKGTAHLGIGTGELAGGSVTVHADRGAVTIVVDAPPGVDGAAFGARLDERLRARGIDATIELR